MWDHDCGCLPVTEGNGSGRLAGIITDRDICMTARFAGGAPDEIPAAEAMTEAVWACSLGDELAEAEAIMKAPKVSRHRRDCLYDF